MSQDPHRPNDPHRSTSADQTAGQWGQPPAPAPTGQPQQQAWGQPQPQPQTTWSQTTPSHTTTSRPTFGPTTHDTTTVTPARPNQLPVIGGGLAALGGLLGLLSQWLPVAEYMGDSRSLWDYRDLDDAPSNWLLITALLTLLGGLATLATRHIAAAGVTALAALLFLWKAIQYRGDFSDTVDKLSKLGSDASLGIAPWLWLLGSILGVAGAVTALVGLLRHRTATTTTTATTRY